MFFFFFTNQTLLDMCKTRQNNYTNSDFLFATVFPDPTMMLATGMKQK